MEKSQIQPLFSVSDFVAIVNQSLEYAFPVVEIEGEVASFNINQGKYIFFDIKDNEAIVYCFMMIWQLRVPIEDGMKVIITASPKLTQKGKFSLTVKSIRPSGEGSIKKSFEILKNKLSAEGIFTPERKRSLPKYPEHIAVISSTQAAGYADFIKILNDRWSGVKIDVANTLVQGSDAPDQIISALNYFNQQEKLSEVIVIIRGGGSEDDLSTFNDEPLVRAIASSRIPVLVGVGHEINESLADLAADVSASTPSNAAQILVPNKYDVIKSNYIQIKYLISKIDQNIIQQKKFLKSNLEKVINLMNLHIENYINRLKSTKKTIHQLDPNILLFRGYSILRGKIELNNVIEIETYEKIIKAEVKNVREK